MVLFDFPPVVCFGFQPPADDVPQPVDTVGRPDGLLGFVEILSADGVVAEADGIELLEPVADVLLGGRIVVGGDVEGFAVVLEADVAFFDEDLAGFDDVAGEREHGFLVLVGRVDGDVGVSAGAEVAFVFQAEDARRAGAGDDGDFVEGVGAIEVGEL